MCGRFQVNETSLAAVADSFKMPALIQQELPLGMIYPSMNSLVLLSCNHQLSASVMEFGFFFQKMNKRILNARSETVLEKPVFAKAIRHHRCVIPCSWFYEWNRQKERFSFKEPGKEVLYLAGFYMENQFIILTRPADDFMQPYHSRMPLILSKEQVPEWILERDKVPALLFQASPLLETLQTSRQPSLF